MNQKIGILLICLHSLHASAQNWEAVGLGAYAINSGVEELYSDTVNNLLYGSGSFKTSAGDTIFGIAKWDGIKWDSLGAGLPSNSRLEDITMYNGELYICGYLTSAGGIPVNGSARWDGATWDSVGGGGAGVALHTYNNELYGGGGFTFNGVYSPIGKWDGIKWDSVGSPSTYPWTSFGTVWAIGDFNGELFLGGHIVSGFTNEGVPKEGITKFDGTTWDGLTPHGVHATGSSCETPVRVFTEYNNQLYIGGCFYKGDLSVSPNIGSYIVRWDGDSLHDVGGGVNQIITDFAIFNGELYAVGDFWYAGGVPAQYIAKWNGTEWCGLGSQFNGAVASIEVHNNELYIGGFFTTIDGENISRVAKWIGVN